MHFLNSLVLATAALVAAAPNPTPNASDAHQLERRMTDNCKGGFGIRLTLPHGIKIPGYIGWRVQIVGAKDYTHGDNCGGGFLDNFRGRCGVITDWGCDYDENTADATMTFETSDFCTAYDITQAIKAASYGERETPCALYDTEDKIPKNN